MKPVFRIASLNSASVVIKILIGVISSKVLAIFIGPAGMALAGNMRNFFNSIESISTLGLQNGIVKYVAEAQRESERLSRIISTVFITLIIVSLFLSLGFYLFAQQLNDAVFGHSYEFASVFKIAALSLPWLAISMAIISILNGMQLFNKVIIINIAGNILGLLISLILVWHFRTLGALMAIVLAPAMLFFVSFYFIVKELVPEVSISTRFFDARLLSQFSSFTLMAVVSGVAGPLTFLAIRQKVIIVVGLESAGYWESISRISGFYMMFLSTVLSVYFLPNLSVATTRAESRDVLREYFVLIMPFFTVGLIILYFIRDFVIRILFTPEFEPVSELFLWQLTGDFFKGCALILGYQLFARSMTVTFIITELASLTILFWLSNFLVLQIGLQGVVLAHCINYVIYFVILCVIHRKVLISTHGKRV
ncbi:MAG TPA: O-antigen translocase [Flavobacterium sp.]|jgi:PST family polysaccharide transporter